MNKTRYSESQIVKALKEAVKPAIRREWVDYAKTAYPIYRFYE